MVEAVPADEGAALRREDAGKTEAVPEQLEQALDRRLTANDAGLRRRRRLGAEVAQVGFDPDLLGFGALQYVVAVNLPQIEAIPMLAQIRLVLQPQLVEVLAHGAKRQVIAAGLALARGRDGQKITGGGAGLARRQNYVGMRLRHQ